MLRDFCGCGCLWLLLLAVIAVLLLMLAGMAVHEPPKPAAQPAAEPISEWNEPAP